MATDPNELPSIEEGRAMLARNIGANPEDMTIAEQQEQARVAQMAAARGTFQSPITVPEEEKQAVRDDRPYTLDSFDVDFVEDVYDGNARLVGFTFMKAMDNEVTNPKNPGNFTPYLRTHFWKDYFKAQGLKTTKGERMQIVADLKNMFHIRYLIATGHASSKSKHNLRIYKETGPTNIGKTVNKIYRRNNMEKDQKARRKAEKRAKRMPALAAVDERKKEVEVPQQGSLRLRGGAPSPEPERPSNIKEAYDELDEIAKLAKMVQDIKRRGKSTLVIIRKYLGICNSYCLTPFNLDAVIKTGTLNGVTGSDAGVTKTQRLVSYSEPNSIVNVGIGLNESRTQDRKIRYIHVGRKGMPRSKGYHQTNEVQLKKSKKLFV